MSTTAQRHAITRTIADLGVSVRNMSPAANAVVFIRRLAEG